MNKTFICFWCEKQLDDSLKTKEHLLPRCLGGKRNKNNIKHACRECNTERGILTEYFAFYKKIIMKIDQSENMPVKMIKKYNKKSASMKSLFRKWTKIEKNKLSFSYTQKIPFEWIIKDE